MEISLHQEFFEIDTSHWWFLGRRRIVETLLRRLPLRRDAEVLEVGCGAGGNLAMLAHYGRVYACEYDNDARKHALGLGITDRIEPCALPAALPFAGKTFDLIVMLDVLEHIEADGEALATVRQRLRADGWLVLTVPAFPFLWSPHDERAHHVRRYTRALINRQVEGAGFRRAYGGFFNFWLFPAVALVRFLKTIRGRRGETVSSDFEMPPSPLNRFLAWVLASERLAIGRFPLPFGVSYIMSAQPATSG